MSSNPWPHELSLGDLYFSPVILVVLLGFFATGLTILILNRLKISRWLLAHSYLFLAIWLLYILAIDRWWIHF